MTKGEKMLIDLGYEKREQMCICEICFYNSKEDSIIRFECDMEYIESERNGTILIPKEIQAIHQIMIDYGWIESESD